MTAKIPHINKRSSNNSFIDYSFVTLETAMCVYEENAYCSVNTSVGIDAMNNFDFSNIL